MNHLTFEQAEEASKCCDYAIEAAGTKENPINWGDAAGFYLSGYNTCADEAEKEIQETTELANRSYNEGLMDGRLPIPGLEKEIAELNKEGDELQSILRNVQRERDEWMNEYFKLKLASRENPSQVNGFTPIDEIKDSTPPPKQVNYTIPPKIDSVPGAFQNVRYGPQSEINDWPPTMDQALRSANNSSQPSSDWHTKHLTAHIELDERLRKLETSCIMDGEVVLIHGIGNKLITKIK